ncbi:DUF434 domain-containing protein [Salinibacter ruber]|uniref:DUF434 domain-containing protein n=1 Tax=Salinibacter ruber TaxID=146919 RepID=UPI0021677469|nr:DUF434 domain-containing protein [Salinibacter ruber]MCS4050159.1 hypothetical protein [Salinibacter ruber]
MPVNRGAHPEDPGLFGDDQLGRLRAAVRDLSWLRTRGYSGQSAQELVGNRYQLKRRQRDAVARSSCSDAERAHRLRGRLSPESISGRELHLDGFNVLITIEAMLGGAYSFVGRDAAYRDVDPVQGTYRVAHQTAPALRRLADTLQALRPARVTWHLDRSVSNVGRVTDRIADVSAEAERPWTLTAHAGVDAALKDASAPIVTSDSAVLDASDAWLPLEGLVHARHVPDAHVVDLRPDGERSRETR